MEVLVENLTFLTWQQVLMWLIGGVLIYLAIVKEMEPSLLLPMGFGAILVNLPNSGAAEVIAHLFELGIAGHELFPLLLFIGIGAMIDFQPLLANPKLMIFGAAAQFGIFFTLGLASLLGFELNDAASIAIIGAADGPTSIFVAQQLGSGYTAAIMVAAYSYMALVPIVQPFCIRLITTKKERMIRMEYTPGKITKTTRILFPIVVTVIAGIVSPQSVALVGFLMFGNLLRECGLTDRLSDTAQNALMNIVTILLSTAVGATMVGSTFLTASTLKIVVLGVVAFGISTAGGLLGGNVMCKLTGRKVNPLIGSAGVSAVPMAARVSNTVGQKNNPSNFLLMHAMGPNVAGVIGSAIAAGFLLSVFG